MARVIVFGGVVLSLLSATTLAWANNDPIQRAAGFVHRCKGGDNAGDLCNPTDADACPPRGNCFPVIAKKVKAIMTVIVDDDVRGLDGSTLESGGNPSPVSAMTALLEVKGKTLFAQTFQDLCPQDVNGNQACGNDPTLGELIVALKSGPVIVPGDDFNPDRRITEATVGGIFGTDAAGSENLLQFRTGFGFNEALRAHFEITGPEVPVITTVQKVDFMDRHTDGLPNGQTADGVATVLRFQLGIVFLTPVQP
jgi:hypothetical protein